MRNFSTPTTIALAGIFACIAPPPELAEDRDAIINGSRQVEDNSSMIKIATPDALCSGALLRNDWVVTAKHCVDTGEAEDPLSITALMGMQSRDGRRVVLHKNYDVALVQVGPRFLMNGVATGWYRELHRNPTSELDDQWLISYGYGLDAFSGGNSGVLLSGDVHVSSTSQDSFDVEPGPNETIGFSGDSGGPCFFANITGSYVAGVLSTATTDSDEVLSNHLVAANRFRDWAEFSMGQDSFGGALAAGDFNCDGLDDVAIGSANELLQGRVAIFRGTSTGFAPFATLDQTLHGELNETGDRFGAALAAGDFNNDGCDELAVGAPGKRISNHRSGYVLVFRGGQSAMQTLADFNQTGFGINEEADEFGAALAAGDFDGDGRDDLAVGAPGEAPGENPRTGVVFAMRSTGTSFAHQATLEPSSGEYYDRFGHALAVGDFNNDGRDDLAVAAPGAGLANAGVVTIFRGSSTGLGSATQTLSQIISLIPLSIDNESGDLFGWSVAAGDFDGDGDDDLAVGVPGEVVSGGAGAGSVWIYRAGSSFAFWKTLTQGGLGVDEHGDFFGAALATGDVDNDGKEDLIVGAPSEAPGSSPESGFAFAFHGTTTGPTAWASVVELGAAGEHDRFGSTIVSGDFNNDGRADVAVARPGDAIVDIFRGTSTGPSANTSLSMP